MRNPDLKLTLVNIWCDWILRPLFWLVFWPIVIPGWRRHRQQVWEKEQDAEAERERTQTCDCRRFRMCRVWICAEDSYTGRGRWDHKAIDACLADQVNALNAAGRLTRSACCGHGKGDGAIILHDGTRIPAGRRDKQQSDSGKEPTYEWGKSLGKF